MLIGSAKNEIIKNIYVGLLRKCTIWTAGKVVERIVLAVEGASTWSVCSSKLITVPSLLD